MNNKKRVLAHIRNSAIIRNPLLFEAVGLCPVVAIATSLKSAALLALLTALEMIICEVFASLFLKNVRRYIRVALYFLLGIAVIFPIMAITKRFIPSLTVDFGVYLPLMAVNSLIALHCERIAVKRKVKNSFIDAVSASFSYGLTAIATGFLRELFGNGTIGGHEINIPVKFSALLLPFGGLLILGFLAAVLKAFIAKAYPDMSPDYSFDTSEVRRSLRGSLRELMNDDFNPYGEESDIIPEGAVYIKKHAPKHAKKIRMTNEDTIKITDDMVKAIKEADENQNDTDGKKSRKKLKHKKINRKKEKSVQKNLTPTVDETVLSMPDSEMPQDSGERTYLDDFSDMLSELEDYKNRVSADADGSADKDADRASEGTDVGGEEE